MMPFYSGVFALPYGAFLQWCICITIWCLSTVVYLHYHIVPFYGGVFALPYGAFLQWCKCITIWCLSTVVSLHYHMVPFYSGVFALSYGAFLRWCICITIWCLSTVVYLHFHMVPTLSFTTSLTILGGFLVKKPQQGMMFKIFFLLSVRVIRDKPGYFAKKMQKAMKGLGTDDKSLLRVIVSRCEIDMVQIMNSFQEQFNGTLADWIKVRFGQN